MAELSTIATRSPAASPRKCARDDDVVFLGEDIAKAGGVFKATVGLYEQFGPLRDARHADLRAGDPRRRPWARR